MSDILLKEIRQIDRSAANVLEKADFRTDPEIKSLTREDLHELFPGPEKLKLRRTIFEIINKHNPVNRLLKDVQGFIPHDSLRDALSNNGVLVDYLHMLKDMKTQLDNMQNFLSAHVDFLEYVKGSQPGQQSDRDMMTPKYENRFSLSRGSVRPTQAPFIVTVNYRMVLTGKTFNAHDQILNQIKASVPKLNLVNVEENQSGGECQIILVFCPIVSRIGTDVEAAMRSVTGDESVILVLMHHSHEAKHVVSMRTWAENTKIALHVNVFYHEKLMGLVNCKQNEDAISAIHNELQKHGKKEEITLHSDDNQASSFSANRSTNYYIPPPRTSFWGTIFSK